MAKVLSPSTGDRITSCSSIDKVPSRAASQDKMQRRIGVRGPGQGHRVLHSSFEAEGCRTYLEVLSAGDGVAALSL